MQTTIQPRKTVNVMAKLLPCPFCGCEPQLEEKSIKLIDKKGKQCLGYLVWCSGEYHETSVFATTKKDAIKAWNTRTHPNQKRK